MNSAASASPRPMRPLPDAMVYSSGSAVRDDISGPGTWAFLPARLASGEIVASMPALWRTPCRIAAQQDRAVRPLVTGAARDADRLSSLSRRARVADAGGKCDKTAVVRARRPAMAHALGWGEGQAVAPFYVDLESPVPANGIPKPGPLACPSEGRPPAIRHHLVHAGGGRGDRVRRLVARATAGEDERKKPGLRRAFSGSVPVMTVMPPAIVMAAATVPSIMMASPHASGHGGPCFT